MKTVRPKSAACALALLLVVVATPLMRAEVSAETAAAVNVLILGVIEGPDPISLWEPVREHVDPALLLNQGGADREDGRPSIAFDPTSGWPHASWAYDSNGDFQVAYSQWMGGGWSQTELLTTRPGADLDPRIHAAAEGAVFVSWWEEDTQRVSLILKLSGAGPWSGVEHVTSLTESGRRPSTALWLEQAIVAYERDDVFGGQEIVVATRTAPGVYQSVVAASTPSKEPLEVIVHVVNDRLWLDWRHAADAYAWTQWENGGWGPVHVLPWTDDTWAGQEAARRQIADMAQGAR